MYEVPFYYKLLSLRFGNFRENLFSAKRIKRHISDEKNSRLWQVLLISINDRVILPYRKGFIHMRK